MRRTTTILILLPALALPFAGCGDKEPAETPVACRSGTADWYQALLDPAGDRLLGDEVTVSDCIPPDQTAADQEQVGLTATETATQMAQSLKREVPRLDLEVDRAYGPGPVALANALGYLVGGLERGSERSQGIHATLVNRVRSAATNHLEDYPQVIRKSYEKGYEAGLESG